MSETTNSAGIARENLGIIAGSQSLPFVVAEEARAAGVANIVAIGFEGETNPELTKVVDELIWLRVGQLSKMIAAFKKRGVTQCVMAGQIAPKNLFDVRPDLRAMMMLFKLKEKNAHTIFGAIGNELEKDGVKLVEATPWLKRVMPQAGFLIGPKLSKEQREDLDFGFRIGKEISKLDIGQTVVVKNGVVLAVEGFEGTDACLSRGGQLAGKERGAVAVKVAKANHDMRFDIPCVGSNTIKTCIEAGIAALGFEGGRTILLERAEVELLAGNNKMSVVAI